MTIYRQLNATRITLTLIITLIAVWDAHATSVQSVCGSKTDLLVIMRLPDGHETELNCKAGQSQRLDDLDDLGFIDVSWYAKRKTERIYTYCGTYTTSYRDPVKIDLGCKIKGWSSIRIRRP